MLDKLEALARQGARASNDAVLDLVVELLALRGEVLRPAARDACVDLLLLILGRASVEARRAAARRLADMPNAPRPVLLKLVQQPIEIAAPVLERGRTLSATDLAGVLSQASPAHVRAVSRRDALSEAQTDLIVLRGDREAIVLALANRRARFSASSLMTLADKAAAGSPVLAALVRRGDLPPSVVETLWPALYAARRAELVASGWRYGPAEVEEVAREANAMAAAGQGAVGPGRPDGGEGAPVRDDLAGLLDAGRLAEAAQVIADAHGLAFGVVLNLLYGVYDRGVALLARHVGLDDSAVLQAACARSRLSWVRAADARRMVQLTATVEPRQAREVLAALDAAWAAEVAEAAARRRMREAA